MWYHGNSEIFSVSLDVSKIIREVSSVRIIVLFEGIKRR